MNREIKFRGKSTETGKWLYGCLLLIDGRKPHILCGPGAAEVDPATVGQYTGLKDKNGREIYEGDVMELPETEFNARIIGTIEYQEDSFFIQSRNGGSAWGLHWSLRKHDAYILGNFHDNHKLLKNK